MRAAVGGIIDAKNDLAGQFPLHSQVPLVKISIARGGRPQIVVVGVSPIRKLPILFALRTREACRKRVFESGILRGKIIVRKENRGGLAKGCPGILKIRRRTHSEIDTGAAPHYRLRIESIGKPKSRTDIFAVYRDASHAGGGKLRGAV